jgi:hypothetical protein
VFPLPSATLIAAPRSMSRWSTEALSNIHGSGRGTVLNSVARWSRSMPF